MHEYGLYIHLCQTCFQSIRLLASIKYKIYGIKKIGIFGSTTLNPPGATGDVDVVVELEEPDIFCLIGIKQDLEELLNSQVDIVRYRQNMNPFLKQRIEKDAVYV